MSEFQHLVWSVHSRLSWRDEKTTTTTYTKEADSKVEVWIGQTSTFYRLDIPTIATDNALGHQKQEIELRPEYAIMQFYDCNTPGKKGEPGVCFIQVIPALGDTRTNDVNLLQFPYSECLTRLMLLGKVPSSWNGVDVQTGPDRFELSSWDNERRASKVKSQPGRWTEFHGSYSNHNLDKISVVNGFGKRPLSAFSNIVIKDGRIIKFTRSDETIQAQRLLLPRLVGEFTLVRSDTDAPDFIFKEKARVFDFRTCPPVPLNQFPNKSCPPKTYTWSRDVASTGTLFNSIEARYSVKSPPKSNSVPLIYFILVASSVLILGGSYWFRRKKQGA